MSATENALNQAKNLIEALMVVQDNYAKLVKVNDELGARLKEADASLNALQGDNERYKNINNELMTFLQEEIRKNERLKLGLSQFANVMEQANKLTPLPPEVGGLIVEEPLKKETAPLKNEGPTGPFYGVHTENGEVIIYPPQSCQTTHQLHQFYRLAGLSISPDKLLERGGVLLRGLSVSAKHRLRKHYRLVYPTGIEPDRPFVKDVGTHHVNNQSATHAPMKSGDGW